MPPVLQHVTRLAQLHKADVDKKIIEIPDMDRESLARLFREVKFVFGAEIGTEQGKYAETLLKSHPQLRLYCVDPWEAYKGYREHVSQDKLDGFFEITKERLMAYEDRVNYVRKYSLDAAKTFGDGYLDFVYIDANHSYESVVADISAWYPKVRPGGIISGHDYVRKKNSNFGVVEAVTGYVSAYQISPLFILGRKERIDGERRDRSRSWFWVKP